MAKEISVSDHYRVPLRTALIFSAIITLLSVLMLDGGESARLSATGLTIFWAWVLFGMWQRPRNPTRIDLILIRWSCLPLVVGFQAVVYLVWRWRGLAE